MKREDQIYLSSLQIWNAMDTPIHQSTNLFSEKFKQGSELHYNYKQPFCLQHPEKKAKYILINSEGSNEKLCTKCAIVFAQQGHKIQLIEEDNAKKKQTDSFIDQLLQTKSEIGNIHSHFLCTEANLKKFYNDQYTKVVRTFGNIEKQLQLCKSDLLISLSQSLWSGIQLTNQLKLQAKQVEHQLVTYINDITNHYDQIVQMSTLPFNQIMGGYSSKLFKLQQCLKEIQENNIPYLHYEDISVLNEKHQPTDARNHESTRSSSGQKTCKSVEKDKRPYSQPNSKDAHCSDNSGKKTKQNFKITEQSIEDWMENSNSKQRKTEPAEKIASPNLQAIKFVNKQMPPNRVSMKQETNQAMLNKLINEFSQIKKDRVKTMQSKTPELGKSKQQAIPNKFSPKFLYKNYYK
ncbi:unnamed protein product (macronuclear) [Paramecium tetraurelia]|uniref:Uncharacterized protein n=1 Tax=Paramecium tetraurelia TaxID=5888 RepID=A0D3T5_PARTE|nr:uncharacterized protein GSPATT00013167001 [Paramecium tetraurelia]CAK77702.1 unnamed protein product [Paramecium tetraurelia]|eukprot:XP_001445099.1 hypothetical protein (macronuclear) [Paramecium tetraurelia strain d4-2]